MSYYNTFEDYLESNEIDFLDSWLEKDANWAKFTNWLYDSKQDNVRDALFNLFLNQSPMGKELQEFFDHCRQRYNERVEGDNND